MGHSWVFWVAAGSAIGGTMRYGIGVALARLFGVGFPWGTLLVNASGSLAIGLFFAMTGPGGRFPLTDSWRGFVMYGVLGGFTTFSSFSLQTLVLARQGDIVLAGINVAASLVLCLAGVWIGYAVGTQIR